MAMFGSTWLEDSESLERYKLKQEIEYWKTRCKLVEDILDKTPCDPDITTEQYSAHIKLNNFLSEHGTNE